MQYAFKVIQAGNAEHQPLLDSMHRLRKEVFVDELKWTHGIYVRGEEEYDDYDVMPAEYIVAVTPEDEVVSCCRMIPTDHPYMLGDVYQKFFHNQDDIARSADIWEITRFAVRNDAREQTRGKIFPETIAAAIEFGLFKEANKYLSLTTDWVYNVVKRLGWEHEVLGDMQDTPDDRSIALRYEISSQQLMNVRHKNRISGPMLYDIDTLESQQPANDNRPDDQPNHRTGTGPTLS